MTREERLDLAVRIAHQFKARDMRAHLPPLRRYYADVRDGRESPSWGEELVFDWARAFKLPPFENSLTLQPMSSSCVCGTRKHDATRPMAFPGGWLVTCLSCRRRWLELVR